MDLASSESFWINFCGYNSNWPLPWPLKAWVSPPPDGDIFIPVSAFWLNSCVSPAPIGLPLRPLYAINAEYRIYTRTFLLLDVFSLGVSGWPIIIADSLPFHVSPQESSEVKKGAQSRCPYPFCSYLSLIRNSISLDACNFCSPGTQVREMSILCNTVVGKVIWASPRQASSGTASNLVM